MDPGATGHVEHRLDHLRPAADVLDRASGEEGEVTRVPVAGEIVVVPAHGDTGTGDAPVTHERDAPAVAEEAQHRIWGELDALDEQRQCVEREVAHAAFAARHRSGPLAAQAVEEGGAAFVNALAQGVELAVHPGAARGVVTVEHQVVEAAHAAVALAKAVEAAGIAAADLLERPARPSAPVVLTVAVEQVRQAREVGDELVDTAFGSPLPG